MRGKIASLRLLHLGTFDVFNYGDLLFPLVLERRLGDTVDEIAWLSPTGGRPPLDDCKTVLPLATVERDADVGAVVLGGGHILQGGPPGVRLYRTDDLKYLLTYPRITSVATRLAVATGAPLLLNAPGVAGEAGPAAAQLSRWMANTSSYVNVRDAESARLLRRAGVPSHVEIVPDTALDVAELWTADELDAEHEQAFRRRGVDPPAGGSLAIHLTPRFAGRDTDSLAALVSTIAETAGLMPVIVAVGPCHGDDRLAREVGDRVTGPCLVVDEPRSLREVAALIGRADAYLGSSLHGMITACAFGKPGALIAPPLAKFTGFLESFGLQRWLFASWSEAADSIGSLLASPPDRWQRVRQTAAPQLDRHWDRIATEIAGGKRIERAGRKRARKLERRHLDALLPEMVDAEVRRSVVARQEAERALRELRAKTSDQRARDATELSRAEGRAEALGAELERATTALEVARAEATRAQAEIAEQGARLEQAVAEVSGLQADVERRDATLADQRRGLVEARSARLQTERSLRDARAQAAALQTRLDETLDGLGTRDRDLARLREQLAAGAAELERARAESRAERSALRARDQALSDAALTLRAVGDHLERVDRSRSWRFGHALFRWLRIATLRRPVGDGAVAEARRDVGRSRDSAERAGGGARHTRVEVTSGPDDRDGSTGDHEPVEPEREHVAALGRGIRDGLGSTPDIDDSPFVSILVVNRNGRAHLVRLLAGLSDQTEYARFELIVVDNGSTDGSVELLEGADPPFGLQVIVNERNASFSEANNQAAERASGELLLLLNNDVQPVEPGWLAELVACRRRTRAGAVGAVLVHADAGRGTASGWEVQHRGIRFGRTDGFLKGFNEGAGEDPFDAALGADRDCPGVTAACLLVPTQLYERVGGLHRGYSYGTEDIDFCLSLQELGERVVCCGRAVLLHYESSTQKVEGRAFMRINRLGNRQLFYERWGPRLWREIQVGRLEGDAFWTPPSPPDIAITRTSNAQREGYGDWYTAKEIGDALADEGFSVTYIEARGDRWHSPGIEADYVLALLDRYDPSRAPVGATTVAWVRNWTDRWIDRRAFDQYAVVLVSSSKSAEIVAVRTGKPSVLFPLATNPARFRAVNPAPQYEADFVFAGNRWNQERPIEQAFEVRSGERGRVFGSGWEHSAALSRLAEDPVPYDELPTLYASAKVVLDDASSHTRPYDSVNSRVFDALASGAVVVSNCEGGVRELFDDDFPTYADADSLRAWLDRLLADQQLRDAISERYRRDVLTHHTYAHRARKLKAVLRSRAQQLRFSIKIGAPSWDVSHRWGDLHYAHSLQRALRSGGHDSTVQVLPEWDDLEGLEYDVALHLKGRSRYRPKAGQLNVLWCISHPDLLDGEECDAYDVVFVASARFAETLRKQTKTPVHVLEQASDPRTFWPEPHAALGHDLAFVGNSRKVKRRILQDLLPTDHDLAVWGGDWNGMIPDEHVFGDYLDPADVRKVYSSAGIVLNDHWDDMRAHGFVSNRIYDALACGAFVISDRVSEIDERFDGAVVTYEGRDELKRLVDHYLANPDERCRLAEQGRSVVLSDHTFEHRVGDLLEIVRARWDELGLRSTVRPQPSVARNGASPPRRAVSVPELGAPRT